MPLYCTAEDVKALLNTCRRQRILFSSNSLTEVKTLKKAANNSIIPDYTINFNYNVLTYDPSFTMNGSLRIKFTSPTNFSVFEVAEKIDNEILIGTGNTSTVWNHPRLSPTLAPIMTIPVTAWVSGFVLDSIVQLKYDTHLSTNAIDVFIDESEIMIDQMLADCMLVKVLETGRAYTSLALPQQVSLACKYLSAYYVYVSLYSDTFVDKEKSLDYSLVRNWKAKAEDLVKSYARVKGRRVPSVVGFPTFMDQMGVDGEGPGMVGTGSSVAELSRDAQTTDILSDT